jgi:tripartite-type tricarboxylate transporter receptor subunit TctC
MKSHCQRRRFLKLAASTTTLSISRLALAFDYPTRPVRIVVGYPAGGTADIIARVIAQWLSERLGQQFIVENRPGANASIAATTVARAAPDGYTLLLAEVSNAINATLYGNLNYNFFRDFAPIAGIGRVPLVMEVNLSVPAYTVPEFIAYAKANPDKINMGSGGVGDITQIAGALFMKLTGVSLFSVPYRGVEMLTGLMSGQVQVNFAILSASLPHIKAGRLRALAVTTATRYPTLPDLPTVGEFVPGYEASSWEGLAAPKDTPPEIVENLNKQINAGLDNPKLKERLSELGNTVLGGPPAEFGMLIADETAKWGAVVNSMGMKPN